MPACAEPYPADENILCDKNLPCWSYHSNIKNKVTWPGIPLPVATPKERRQKLALTPAASRA